MDKALRRLKNDAADARCRGRHKRALAIYHELEAREPSDGSWSTRAAGIYRRMGENSAAIAALERAHEKYLRAGFLSKAIASYQIILQIDPNHMGARACLRGLGQRR